VTLRIAGLMVLVLVGAAHADAQVRHVVEMTAEELRRMDHATTAVIIPGGILEQHGPYLPTFSDGYLNERLARSLADAVVARPGWQALIFPTIPLGNSGANDIGGKFAYPGTYAVRFETLRAIFMDLADELGAQGFRSIFVVHRAGYRDAPALSGSDMAELVRVARDDGWPGYFGSPRLATAAHGAAIWERLRTEAIDVALRLLDGGNPRDLPRFTATMDQSAVDAELDAASLTEEARRAERQQQWLRRTGGQVDR
jgi:hypothetical protein